MDSKKLEKLKEKYLSKDVIVKEGETEDIEEDKLVNVYFENQYNDTFVLYAVDGSKVVQKHKLVNVEKKVFHVKKKSYRGQTWLVELNGNLIGSYELPSN